MRIVIIGGTGHIGSFLTPRLVEAGHALSCVSRGMRRPYHEHSAWKQVAHVEIDRTAEESARNFGERIAALDPQVVVDLTCFKLESAQQLFESLRGRVDHLLHCGTIWVHGHSVEVPTKEDEPRQPFGEYGMSKAAIESYFLKLAEAERFPVTILHPGHIVGAGWAPLNPAGNFNSEVFSTLLKGDEIVLPNLGLETVHHVHADDVAQSFVKVIEHFDVAVAQSFHVVSPAALTLRGYAERIAQEFGQPARITFLPWENWRRGFSELDAAATWDHISHSPNCSIQKARKLLGYEPRYTSIQAVKESVDWLIQNGMVRVH